jgi:hypothetical protein
MNEKGFGAKRKQNAWNPPQTGGVDVTSGYSLCRMRL